MHPLRRRGKPPLPPLFLPSPRPLPSFGRLVAVDDDAPRLSEVEREWGGVGGGRGRAGRPLLPPPFNPPSQQTFSFSIPALSPSRPRAPPCAPSPELWVVGPGGRGEDEAQEGAAALALPPVPIVILKFGGGRDQSMSTVASASGGAPMEEGGGGGYPIPLQAGSRSDDIPTPPPLFFSSTPPVRAGSRANGKHETDYARTRSLHPSYAGNPVNSALWPKGRS